MHYKQAHRKNIPCSGICHSVLERCSRDILVSAMHPLDLHATALHQESRPGKESMSSKVHPRMIVRVTIGTKITDLGLTAA